MTKKEKFISEIEPFIKNLSEDAQVYFEALKEVSDKDKPVFTQNGAIILKFIQENKDNYNNLFKAKDVGEGIGISSKTASGSMRKLVNDGFLEKIGEKPTIYSLTDKGMNIKIEAEEN